MAEALKDDDLKKGDAAPLEGTLGPQIMMLLNIGFTCMTLGMCQNLALTAGQALDGPLLKNDLATLGPQLTSAQSAMTNTIAGGPGIAPTNPFMSGPKMGGMFG